jgi:hypothetical protein
MFNLSAAATAAMAFKDTLTHLAPLQSQVRWLSQPLLYPSQLLRLLKLQLLLGDSATVWPSKTRT